MSPEVLEVSTAVLQCLVKCVSVGKTEEIIIGTKDQLRQSVPHTKELCLQCQDEIDF